MSSGEVTQHQLASENLPDTRPRPSTPESALKHTLYPGRDFQSSHPSNLNPSYNPSAVEFNFSHGHGSKYPYTTTDTSLFHETEQPAVCNDEITSCKVFLDNLRQNSIDGDSSSLSDDLVSKYPDLNPDFDDPSTIINASDKGSKFASWLTLNLILLACGSFANGWSDGSLGFNIQYISQLLTSLVSFGLGSMEIASRFPSSLYQFKKALGMNNVTDSFTRSVVCPDPTCCKLYQLEDCYSFDKYGNKIPKTCSAPIYKYGVQQRLCGQELMKSKYTGLGARSIVPKKTFIQRSITEQIEEKLCRPGVEDFCQKWRHENLPSDVRKDVHSGKTWKKMQSDHNFFTSDYEIGLQYNIDWWQPHKHSQKSLGVMYLAICNLPREIRYKRENLIIAGIIPSLDFHNNETTRTEPESLNPFQRPLVDELLILWDNEKKVKIRTHKYPDGVRMRAALLMNASDSPAARKSSGFLAHSACYGCPRCLKYFPGKVGEKYYGGFHDYWPPRTLNAHRAHIDEIRTAENDTQRKKLQSKYGCKDSAFNDLPYFDIIRSTVVDPMHNLFQGTAKSFFRELVDREILTGEKLSKLTDNLHNIHVSTNNRWIPSDINSRWTFYNSYHWKEWTLTYSLIAFRGVLPQKYLEVWQLFVQACHLICQPVLTMTEANEAHELFKTFGTRLEKLWGQNAVKPNQHMHCHLRECIDDFGSPYSFWLFPFERYNGDLGGLSTNCQAMELTYMRKFTEMSVVSGLVSSLTRAQRLLYAPYLRNFSFSPAEVTKGYDQLCAAPITELSQCGNVWQLIDHITMCIKKSQSADILDADDRNLLRAMYQQMYPNMYIETGDVNEFFYRFDKLYIEGTKLCTLGIDPKRHCLIMASWPDCNGLIGDDFSALSMGRINHFLYHKIKLNGQFVPHILCDISWKKEFSDSLPTGYLPPCRVYRNQTVHRGQPSTYMPVQRIHSICAHSTHVINGYPNCTVVLPNKLHLLLNDNCHN